MSTWPSIDAFLTGLGIRVGPPTIGLTTGGSHAAGSEHYEGRARDYPRSTSDADAIARALLPYAQGPGAPVDELFYSPLGIFYDKGRAITPSASLRQGHYSHVHVGLAPGVELTHLGAPTPVPDATLVGLPGLGSVMSGIGRVVLEGIFVAAGVALVALGVLRVARPRSSPDGP
jgi:hypothetical protein